MESGSTNDSRLSASQINTIWRCPREYAWRYIMKYPMEDVKALTVGKLFHAASCGETVTVDELKRFDPDYPWLDYLAVMVAGYADRRKRLPDVYEKEAVYEDADVKLILDEIAVDRDGRWWLLEKKTASKLSEIKKATLPHDIQLLVYTGNIDKIADKFWLDPDLWQGVYYLTTLKPLERKSVKESWDQFGKRLTSSTEVWEFKAETFKGARAKVNTIFDMARRTRNEIHTIYERNKDPIEVPANTSACERYGRPCPYYDLCTNGPACCQAVAKENVL